MNIWFTTAWGIGCVILGCCLGSLVARLSWTKYIDRARDLKTMEVIGKFSKSTTRWDEWYEKLQRYADLAGVGREMITGAGPKCWKEAYDDLASIEDAFMDGLSD